MYSSLDVIRKVKSWRMRWPENAARVGVNTVAYKGLARKSEEERQLGRTFT
jgi:hypothetical protein